MPRVGAPILDALEYWPHVLLPPAVTLVFVLHQCLVEPERASA